MSETAAQPTDGLTRLQYLLATLDAALTGRPWKDVLHTARYRQATLDNLVFAGGDRAYYLSDGGYSRVYVDDRDEPVYRLFLTSNSRDEVKRQWDYCRELVADVENELATLAAG